MGRIISIVNQKGGVGKTTTALNCGAGLALQGKKVLLIDLDPQASLTLAIGEKPKQLERTLYNVLKGEISPSEAIIEKLGMHIIPANLNLAKLEAECAALMEKNVLLKRAMKPLSDQYDYVIIDCPPNMGLLTIMSLAYAKEVFVTLTGEYLPLEGISSITETVQLARDCELNKDIEITGVVLTKFSMRKTLNKEVFNIIHDAFKDKLFKTYIRDNIALAESPSYGQDIFTYKPASPGAEDYAALCLEIIKGE